jgi:hypothetical protein
MWVEYSDLAKLREESDHDISGGLFRQIRFPFGSKLSKSVFNVGVTSN